MATDEPTPSAPTETPGKPDAPDATPSPTRGKVAPDMSEQQIRDAGLAIDVPYETSGEPTRLKYAEGAGEEWVPPEGWPPEQGTPQSPDGSDDDDSRAGGSEA